jgi:hypothetical protein
MNMIGGYTPEPQVLHPNRRVAQRSSDQTSDTHKPPSGHVTN